MQGRALAKTIEEQLGQRPWWEEGQSEMRINCPFCGDDDHKLYIKAFHDFAADGKPNKYAGAWFCFKSKTSECAGGGGLRDLLPDLNLGKNRPRYADRTEERAAQTAKDNIKAPRTKRWVYPGQTLRPQDLDRGHPGYIYWHNRFFDPQVLGDYYGVEYCQFSGGSFETPQGRRSYDPHGWLSTADHFIFPVIMFGHKDGWQARARGAPPPLLWHPVENGGQGNRPEGYWMTPPAGYPPLQEVEIVDPKTDKVKKKLMGAPGDTIDTPPKYFHFFDKKTAVGNFDLARNFKTCVVTEGWTKAIRVGKCAVVTFGKMITDDQIRAIGTYWDRVILLLDKDGENLYHDQMHRRSGLVKPGLVSRFAAMTEVHAVTLEGYDDPGDAPHAEIWRQLTLRTGIPEPKGNADF